MKKNLMRFLALALCLMMICPAALAQESYKIGEPSRKLVADAFMSGKMLNAAVKLGVDIDAKTLGMSEEEAAMLPMILGLLDQTTLTGGIGLIEDGLRLELAGEMTSEAGTESVAVTAAADVTLDGVSVESNLLSGRRVTVKWETLLALAGLSEAEVAEFTTYKEMLRTMDVEQMLTELEAELTALVEQLAPALEAILMMTEPYLATISDWFFALPMEVAENLNEEGYPPTATEIAITVTQKDLGDLLQKLAAQAAQDEALLQYIDMILQQMGETMTAAQLVAGILEEAKQMTDTSIPFKFFLGMNEEGVPLYLEMVVTEPESGESIYGGMFCYEDAEAGFTLNVIAGYYDAEGNAIASLYAGGTHLGDPADKNIHDLEVVVGASADGEDVLTFVYDYDVARAADSELPAYDLTVACDLYANDGYDVVEMTVASEGRQTLQPSGGEASFAASAASVNVEGMEVTSTVTGETLLEPTADGGFTGYYRVNESIPFAGINALDVDAAVFTKAYDPSVSAALQVIELEALSNDEMDALVNEITEVLMNDKVTELVSVLPQDVLALLMAE